MFRVNMVVVYPVHGAGKIVKKYTPKGSSVTYFQIKLFDSSIAVSIPVDRAEELGLRAPTNQREMKALLKNINSSKKLSPETEENLSDIAKDLLYSGAAKDSVEALNLLLSAKRKCTSENRRLSMTAQDMLEQIQHFLESEIKVSIGESLIGVVEA